MKNMTKTPSKRSSLERRLDYFIIVMFTLLAGLCLANALGAAFWVDKVPTFSLNMQSILLQNLTCETSLTLPCVTFSRSIIDVTSSRNGASAEWYANETSSTLQCQN